MDWLPARTALGIMSWFGFVNLYMTRINLSVAIVAMVKRNVTNGSTVACTIPPPSSESFSAIIPLQDYNGTASASSQIATEANDQHITSNLQELQNEEGEMMWDETTQGLVLGSFFYGYALTQIVGGRMAELHGTKIVFGVSILAGGISALLSPVVVKLHYGAFIALRVIQGAFQGVTWPSMHALTTRWIPPLERPRFIAVVYLAATLSSVMTMPLVGVIIANHSWEAQFYVMGILSLVWCCVWFTFMYNTPEEHPRISREELDFIVNSLKASGTKKSTSKIIPWRHMCTSLPMWAIIAFCIGNGWGISLFFSQLPTYMKNVLGFSIRDNGVLSALPFLCRYIGGILWSSLGMWLLSREYLSITTSRRIFSVLALWGPGAMILGVSLAGCSANLNIFFFCVALFFNGAATTSGFVNHTDIAPNFAGTLLGIDNTIGSIVAFIVPIVTGIMTDGQQTLEAWQRVFWTCVPLYFITEIFFLVFVSGEVQPWNDIDLITVKSHGKETSNDIENIQPEEIPLK